MFMPPPLCGQGIKFCPCPYVPSSVRSSYFVDLLLSPQVLLQYLMQGSETCSTVQTCIEHVHKGNKSLIKIIIAELYPIK